MAWRCGWIVISLLCAGCYRESDDFNAKAAERMCRYNAGDPDNPFLDYTEPVMNPPTEADVQIERVEFTPYGGSSCEQDVIANLEACDASCDYSPRKARRCLRRLKRSVRDGSYEEQALSVCNRVYTCEPEVPIETDRACRISTASCAVGSGGSPASLALLLLAAGWSRRRRRA